MATSLDDAMLGPSMLDLMYTSLGRQISDVSGLVGVGGDDLMDMLPQALKSGWANPTTATSTTAGPVTGDGDETAVSIFTAPICDLFVELFDLKENKNNWLRRQAIVVILQQLLGSTIERKVRDTFRSSLQPDSIIRPTYRLGKARHQGPRVQESRSAHTRRRGEYDRQK
jgi:sorting nexin-25